MANWLAVRTVGTFRRGRMYTSAQLGVLGRMAVKAGHIVRADDIPERVITGENKATRPRGARRKKVEEDNGGQAGIQAGGGTEVRDTSGA